MHQLHEAVEVGKQMYPIKKDWQGGTDIKEPVMAVLRPPTEA